jgi:hypothetical protein
MAGIPPNWLGSIIQTAGAARRNAADKAKEGASQSEDANFTERLQDVIESSDRDSQVYSDAEGQGSQGRPSDDAEEPEAKDEDEAQTEDEDEQGQGLDVAG